MGRNAPSRTRHLHPARPGTPFSPLLGGRVFNQHRVWGSTLPPPKQGCGFHGTLARTARTRPFPALRREGALAVRPPTLVLSTHRARGPSTGKPATPSPLWSPHRLGHLSTCSHRLSQQGPRGPADEAALPESAWPGQPGAGQVSVGKESKPHSAGCRSFLAQARGRHMCRPRKRH